MKRYRKNTIRICTLLLAVAAAGMHIAARGEDSERAVFGNERIVLSLPGNGSLGVRQDGDERVGIRWPGPDGTEFLGEGGVFLRFKPEGTRTYIQLIPASFKAALPGAPVRILHEGCAGGKRYPQHGSDDDGDGLTNEDPFDGRDNDGDGLVDEDFAAIGDRMVVTRAAEPVSGLGIVQSSYAWSYGHVRDFVGFTTRLEYPRGMRGKTEKLEEFEAALYIDLDIGDSGNDRRGEDDRFFVVNSEESGRKPVDERFACIAASDEGLEPVYAAVVMLEARGPGGSVLGVEGFIVDAGGSLDSIWTADPLCGAAAADAAETDPAQSMESAGNRESPYRGGAVDPSRVSAWMYEAEGDKAIVHRLEILSDFKPGDCLEINWAVVFGNTRESLRAKTNRAVETYRGMTDGSGRNCRWVVPARKAARRKLEAGLAAGWVRGTKTPAATITLPQDLEAEELEWLKVGGVVTGGAERMGDKLFLPLEPTLVEPGTSLDIIGQMTDGTIFTARLSGELLRACTEGNSLPQDRLPDESLLLYPNPFLTTLNISLHVLGHVTGHEQSVPAEVNGMGSVRIYDVRGRLVWTVLEEEFLPPGDYRFAWDGRDANGSEVAPGVYYCKLQIGSRSLTKRVILLR
jgi:hypothetical protein